MNHNEKREATAAMKPGEPRYQIIPDSDSGHCCFSSTVLDTLSPEDIGGPDVVYYKRVCECFEHEDAVKIAEALNTVADINRDMLRAGFVLRKCGITRAIVQVTDTHVHYENIPTRAITRMDRGKFEDWIHGSILIGTGNPTRRRVVDS